MPPIVSFIGWHDSGKTTLASQVVAHLQERGHLVAVIKSSKETGLAPDAVDTDTGKYRAAGADAVMLVAPDQMLLRTGPVERNLHLLAHRYFPQADIIIAEGFKQARQIAKIEVHRGTGELLRDQVSGVIAIATDQQISGDYVFRRDESAELADFIEKRFLSVDNRASDQVTLLINGRKVVIKDFVQEILTGTVLGFIDNLKGVNDPREVELRIRIPDGPKQGGTKS
jgi:molybdopterin-guanine dinucleotide biosynthesis protein B